MDITLCMIVRNEVDQLGACLADIHDVFTDVVVLDHGSTDGTPALLGDTFGIDVTAAPDTCDRSVLRNASFARAETDWILRLDADERLSRPDVERLRALPEDPAAAGFFMPWITHRPGAPAHVDYKLTLFRRPVKATGVVHEGMQTDLRDRGLSAGFVEDVALHHRPDTRKDPERVHAYRTLLERGIREDPTWVRYHWFLGLLEFDRGRTEDAVPLLRHAAESHSARFPVECLNAARLLATILAGRHDVAGAVQIAHDALSFFDEVRHDFEVLLNEPLRDWFAAASTDPSFARPSA